ncbi:hypothetical protein [Bizionia arctica]|uniref:Uncharacterized protein n=1 Tax=Bizionia arctica TaxID=1495645 RepID=A0A917GMW5_9FLAO|nr:hypothetical protein [Bizionia arctica]GGG52070.1 hypothetical protein GCM10010976_24010 [Bizionia arctica]
MIKINKPPKVYTGHIYIEYTGNNIFLLNSKKGRSFNSLHLFEYFLLNDGQSIRNCFKTELLGKKYIVDFDGHSIFKFNEESHTYEPDDWSYLIEFVPHSNKNIFMVAGRLRLFNEISAVDGRNETFRFNIILDNKEEIKNLFI